MPDQARLTLEGGRSPLIANIVEFGSGGWIFGSHTGPSNHRLRVEALFDQSQGYEPCGLNLATPPRYALSGLTLPIFGFWTVTISLFRAAISDNTESRTWVPCPVRKCELAHLHTLSSPNRREAEEPTIRS